MVSSFRTTLALTVATLLAAGAVGCGGGEDAADLDPVRTTTSTKTTGPTGVTGASGTTALPSGAAVVEPAPPVQPSGGAPAPATETEAPTTSTPAPNTGGASADAPATTTQKPTPLPKQNPACKPGTGAGFPDRPQCEPVEGPDVNEDEGP